MFRARRIITVAALSAALAGSLAPPVLASTTTAGTAKPYQVTVCAPALYVWTHFQACETVSGQGNYIRWVSGNWMFREVNTNFYGHWSFSGFGELHGSSFNTNYGYFGYSGWSLDRQRRYSPRDYQWRYVTPWSYICSSLWGGTLASHVLRARVCFQVNPGR